MEFLAIHRGICFSRDSQPSPPRAVWDASHSASAGGSVNGWSAQAQLLPYLEQTNIAEYVDFDKSYELANSVNVGGQLLPLSAAHTNPLVPLGDPR